MLASENGNLLSGGQHANFLFKNSFLSRSCLVVSIVVTYAHSACRVRYKNSLLLFISLLFNSVLGILNILTDML